jgi:hypothetical protein
MIRPHHPLSSPDLAPPDFFLFGDPESRVRGQHFATVQDVVTAIVELAGTIAKATWEKVSVEWVERLERSLSANGENVGRDE